LQTLKQSSSYSESELIKQDWLREITNECAQKTTIPPRVAEANKTRNKKLNNQKLTKRRLSQSLGFTTRSRKNNTARFASVTKTVVATCSSKNAYPPLKTWVYETEAIRNRWKRRLTSGPRADIRNPYLPMMKVDLSRLDHDIPIDDSRILCDSSGEEVCYVFRDFCPNKNVLTAVNDTIEEAVDVRRNCRVSSFIIVVMQPFLTNDIRWTILVILSKLVSLQAPVMHPTLTGLET